jgi:hypothetical protein
MVMSTTPVNIGLAPNNIQGPRCTKVFSVLSTFAANQNVLGSVTNFDLTMEDAEGAIDNIQTMWVDNSMSPSSMFFQFLETGQRLMIPAKSQGYFPVACGNQVQLQVTAFIPGGGGYQTFFQFFNIPISPCVWSVIDNLRGFAFCNNAIPQAGTSLNLSGGVANGIIKTPGIVFPTSGLLNTDPPAASNPGAITDPFAFTITGLDVFIAGDTGDANTMLKATISAAVSNMFGGNSPDPITIGLTIDANGNSSMQWRTPGNQPGIYSAGFNGFATVALPALTTAPITYSATAYYKQF